MWNLIILHISYILSRNVYEVCVKSPQNINLRKIRERERLYLLLPLDKRKIIISNFFPVNEWSELHVRAKLVMPEKTYKYDEIASIFLLVGYKILIHIEGYLP
jgi:hypothetical protein